MYYTNNVKQIDFLAAYGVEPEYRMFDYYFYRGGPRLSTLLDRYYIMNVCLLNRNERN